MKLNEKNLDTVFRKKLEGHSVPPPPGMMEKIQAQIKNKKKKRAIVLFRSVAAAAIILLAAVAGWMISNTPDQKNRVVENNITSPTLIPGSESNGQVNKSENQNISIIKPSANQNLIAADTKNRTGSENEGHAKTTTDITESKKAVKQTNYENIPFLAHIKAFLSAPAISEKLHHPHAVINKRIDNLTAEDKELIAMNLRIPKNKNEEKDGWGIGVRVAPGYSSQRTSHTESYRENMTYSNTEGIADINGGVSVEYKASGRLRVESGFYYSQNGQQSRNSMQQLFSPAFNGFYEMASTAAGYFNTPVEIKQGKIMMNSTAGIIEFSKTPEDATISATLDRTDESSNILLNSSEFSQVFDFIEIPVLLKYRVIDKRFAIDLIGGLSANWVVGNNVYIGEGTDREYIGKTADISTLNYSGTLGMGIEYALSKKLSVSMEPKINYFLQSINKNDDVNYRPYRVGVYTGINYNF